MSWLLNTIYAGLLVLLSPVIAWRMVRHGRYRRGLPEKLVGQLPKKRDDRPVVWFHAVSVGEVLQLRNVIEGFRSGTDNRYQILLTTSTDSGYDLAVERYSDCTVSWFPLDFSWAVSRALKRVQPEMVVLAELEFWPGFLSACRCLKVKTAVINARMSDHSYQGYGRLQWLIQPLLQHLSVVAVQTDEYAERLIDLGTSPKHTTVTGSIKFDGVATDRFNPATAALRNLFDIHKDDIVLIAGSTQDPEEQMAIDAWAELRSEWPNLRLIIVPRHRERFDSVAALLHSQQVACLRRSEMELHGNKFSRDSVILLDTIGELSACWGLADVAFVGGSFGARQGQNMLEPAAYGAAVLVGPNTANFRDIVKCLVAEKAVIELNTTDQFTIELRRLLRNDTERNTMGFRASEFVQRQSGAIARTIELLTEVSESDHSVSHPTAA